MSETAETLATTAVAKRQKIKTSYDPLSRVATITQVNGTITTHNAADLPAEMKELLFGRGFTSALLTLDEDPFKAHAKLVAGEYGGRSAAKPKELDPWRLSAAHALVERSKKDAKKTGAVPLTLEDAKVKAAAITREQLDEVKRDPLVVTHHKALNPPKTDILAGLMSEAVGDAERDEAAA